MQLARIVTVLSTAAALTWPAAAQAQRAPYGPPISLEQAKLVVSAAEAEAKKNNWNVAIAVLDSGCNLVLLHKIDNTNLGGIEVSQDKARSACSYRGPTKAAEETLAKGGLGVRLLALRGMVPLEGGLVLVADGKTVGAIGVSGVQSDQDGVIAKAGADALK
jgi:glc operon protein GlcG